MLNGLFVHLFSVEFSMQIFNSNVINLLLGYYQTLKMIKIIIAVAQSSLHTL